MINLRLPYPVSANVYWRVSASGGRSVTYVSNEAKNYKQAVKILGRKAVPISGDVSVSIELLPKLTKGGKAHKQVLDLDNAIKVTLDALIGVAYADDKQVKYIKAKYGEPVQDGGLVVVIEEYLNGGF